MLEKLLTADLVVDAVYQGGRTGNASDDPLPKLVGVSNQGGFQYLGCKNNLKMVVLITGFDDPDWPDELARIPGTVYLIHKAANRPPLLFLHLVHFKHCGNLGEKVGSDNLQIVGARIYHGTPKSATD